LRLLVEAIAKAGHTDKVKIGMDVAASEFKNEQGNYDLDFKTENNGGKSVLTPTQLTDLYAEFVKEFPIVSIEDPFD